MVFVLIGIVALVLASLAYVYVAKSKKVDRLKLRAEYSNAFGLHESRIATMNEL
jgi:ABC-type transporter Mla subunit MlaD